MVGMTSEKRERREQEGACDKGQTEVFDQVIAQAGIGVMVYYERCRSYAQDDQPARKRVSMRAARGYIAIGDDSAVAAANGSCDARFGGSCLRDCQSRCNADGYVGFAHHHWAL